MFSHLRADSQAPLQALLILGHAKREVAVPAVHRADPALQLRHVGVAFLHQVVRQLDQQLHLLLGLLGGVVAQLDVLGPQTTQKYNNMLILLHVSRVQSVGCS